MCRAVESGVSPATKDSSSIFGWPHSLWARLCDQCPLADLTKQAASLHSIKPHQCQTKGNVKAYKRKPYKSLELSCTSAVRQGLPVEDSQPLNGLKVS